MDGWFFFSRRTFGWKDQARWSVMYNQLASISVDISSGRFPVSMLGDISTVSYGIQKCPANRPGQHARPYLRVANVQRGELDLSEIKRINVPDSDMQSFRLEPGDLLVCEGKRYRHVFIFDPGQNLQPTWHRSIAMIFVNYRWWFLPFPFSVKS